MNGGGRQLRISAWAIKNPVPVAVLFIAVVIAGVFSYFTLPVKNFPNVEFPLVQVIVTQSGAAPSEMESQVTRPIEDAVAGISNVEAIQSTVTQGVSTTFVRFQIGQDLQKATDDVRSKVDQARAQLPREIDPPTVERVNISDQPIITYAVSAPSMSTSELSWLIDDTVARDLQGQSGVAQVNRVGGVDREINVVIDPVRMAAQGVTAPQVNDAIFAMSLNSAGGRVQVGDREQTLRVLGAATTVDQVRNLVLPATNHFVRLSDVADVGDGSAEVRQDARYDGRPVVGFMVSKTKESSDVATEDGVDAALARIQQAHPGVTVRKIFSAVDQTRASFRATLETMLEGMALASFVVWLFLRDWRATLITALAMPVSLIPTFAVMALVGFSLDTVSLLALTLVIGILVDDAIVEIENIEKRVHVGVRPYTAAMEGADQIGLAVVATTFTLVVVFTPVSFMPGISGQFFKEFGLTISVAVLFSLAVARLVTPLLAAYFLRAKPGKPRAPLPKVYTSTLTWALDHRLAALGIGTVVFLASVALIFFIPVGLQPEGNPNFYQVNVEAPPGSTLADVQRVVAQLTDFLDRQPETDHVFSAIGSGSGGGGGFGPGSSAGITGAQVTAVLKDKRAAKVPQIRERIRAELRKIPDARLSFEGSGFGGATAQVILTSNTGQGLDAAALELQREMRGMRTLADPRPSSSPAGPELIIQPRPDDAARLGVSSQTIANVARVATVGDIDANVPKMDVGERRLPIRVRLPLNARSDLPTIKALRVPTLGGGSTTLDSVADVYFQAGPAEIDRLNRKRQITTLADLAGGAQLGNAYRELDKLQIMHNLPPGVVNEKGFGNQQALGQLLGGFVVAIVTGVGLVYGVLVLLFGSFFKPGTILSALPTAVGGAFLALLVSGAALSIPSLIGFLMLMGLAAKNSILLVEYAIEREREGHSQRAALLEACRERARPIVMTTVAMAAGMLPTALALGKGSEFRQPMAIAVIGGLMTSTILSLVLVPVVYEFVDDFESWLKPRLARMITPKEAPLQPVPQDRL
ncbi:MAG: efflux RND transporter permease subunit [Caulobacterales bacterium]